jgi:hypothetical protein
MSQIPVHCSRTVPRCRFRAISALLLPARRGKRLLGRALSQLRDRLPLAPGRQAGRVVVLGDGKRRRAEEHPQRRRVSVNHTHDRRGRSGRISRNVAGAPLLLALAEPVIGRNRLRVLRRRPAPIRRKAARLDKRDMDPELADLLRQRLTEPLQTPLRRVIDADGRERGDPPIEDTWTMWPLPCSRRNGSAAWVTHSAPNRLVSICARASCSEISSTIPKWPYPALLTTISKRPKCLWA